MVRFDESSPHRNCEPSRSVTRHAAEYGRTASSDKCIEKEENLNPEVVLEAPGVGKVHSVLFKESGIASQKQRSLHSSLILLIQH